jgi:ABC-2 type transport system permease protein
MAENTWFLIKELAITDFKLRYNSSVLGYLWSLLNPLMMFGVLYIVFSIFMRFGEIENYQLYLLLGIIIWNYFAESTSNGMASMQFKSSLITKINFPKWIILVASNLTSILTLCLNLIVFGIFFFVSGVNMTASMLLFVFYLLELFLLSFAVSLILCSYYLKFRDLQHLWAVFIQIGFWLTPIIYPITAIPGRVRQLFFLNPMARIITDSRYVLIYDTIPTLRHNIISVLIIGTLLGIGIYVFKKRSKTFAEEV